MRLYVVREERMHEVALQYFEDGQLVRRIDAAEATWDGDEWVFSSGVERTFAGEEEIAQPFDQLIVEGLVERPEDFAKETRQPSEMNFFELRKFVDRLRASGARVANYLVDLHIKLAFPLVNLIVVVIGASIATPAAAAERGAGFGLSVAIAFIYYAFMRTGQALGHNGALTALRCGMDGRSGVPGGRRRDAGARTETLARPTGRAPRRARRAANKSRRRGANSAPSPRR